MFGEEFACFLVRILFNHPKEENMKRILVVEDEEALLFGLKKLLQNSETSVDIATNLQEARKLLSQNTYNAILTDLRLSGAGGLEGYEVAKLAKELQENCKIIMITAYAENMSKESVQGLGVDFFLEKPVSPKKIKEILESIGSQTETVGFPPPQSA
jgi:CheY-like chemotaxis protein